MADNNNSSLHGKSVEVSKKSFEYKVSKKVAELIQVVHMLFTKNHERELELQATKDAYEEEIANVIRDARNRLAQLEQTLNDEKRRCEVQVKKIQLEASNKEKQNAVKLREACKNAKESGDHVVILQKQNCELHERLKQIESEHTALQKLNENLSSELQQQVETKSRASQNANDSQTKNLTAALTQCQAELQRREEDLKKLHAQLAQNQEADTKKSQHEKLIDKLKLDLNHTKINLKTDKENWQQRLDEIRRENERLEQKNRNLEVYLKQVKENELRSSSVSSSVNEQMKQAAGDSKNQVPPQSTRSYGSFVDPREEVEKLRREIRWYRSELSNREDNFNRMFTDRSPIRLAGRVGSLAVTRSKTDMSMRTAGARKQQGSPVSYNSPARQRVGHHERLPALSMDYRQRGSTRMETLDHH
ncbi:uncharacterized protein [Amphiura filiformis]|uniref:uncharacterized protein n=1 Tax=Amphiura filiformis TaxID=82378 RepID=UPI003B212FAE